MGQAQAPYQLDGCHVLFPPKVGLSHRAKGRQSIVQVHDDVHGGVYHGMERAHSSCEWTTNRVRRVKPLVPRTCPSPSGLRHSPGAIFTPHHQLQGSTE